MDEQLRKLARAISDRNQTDATIARIIGRPPEKGHIGEFIAAGIFDIALEESAVHKGADGRFRSGALAGRTVNIKLYGKQEGLLDINPNAMPDDFLVLAGPRAAAVSSRGGQRPIVIESVHLFDAAELLAALKQRGVKIGVATSVTRDRWDQAEIYPNPRNPRLPLTANQKNLLRLFSSAVQLVRAERDNG